MTLVQISLYCIHTCQQKQKIWEEVTLFSLNQHVFSDKLEDNDKSLKSTFNYIGQILTFCKPIPKAYLEGSQISKMKFFLVIFPKKFQHRCSTGFYICLCIHLHTNRSHKNICILNIFATKYLFVFLQKKNVMQSSSKWIKGNFESLYFILANICIQFVWFIPSDALRIKPNAKYSIPFHCVVVLQKVLREIETVIMRLSGK